MAALFKVLSRAYTCLPATLLIASVLLLASCPASDARIFRLKVPHPLTGLSLGPFVKPGPSDARSPCPAFNILANHGVFPRDGSAIKRKTIVDGFNQFYGFSKPFIETLVEGAYALGVGSAADDTIDLVQLRAHGKIEHDGSLVRDDVEEGNNWLVNATLYSQLEAYSSDKTSLTVNDLGRYRRDRYAFLKADDPNFQFGAKEELLAFGESALMLSTLGNLTGSAIPLAALRQFLLEERYPDGLVPPFPYAGVPTVAALLTRVKVAAGLQS